MLVSVQLACQSGPASPSVPKSGVLYSWKEIAGFLKCGLRTAQRWERKEGLPVHRHQHDKGSTLFARCGEIEEWLRTREPSAPVLPSPTVRLVISQPANQTQAISELPHQIRCNQIRSLNVQLDMALAYIWIALGAYVDSTKRARNAAHAIRIRGKVLTFVEALTFTDEEAQLVAHKFKTLDHLLGQLREHPLILRKPLHPTFVHHLAGAAD